MSSANANQTFKCFKKSDTLLGVKNTTRTGVPMKDALNPRGSLQQIINCRHRGTRSDYKKWAFDLTVVSLSSPDDKEEHELNPLKKISITIQAHKLTEFLPGNAGINSEGGSQHLLYSCCSINSTITKNNRGQTILQSVPSEG